MVMIVQSLNSVLMVAWMRSSVSKSMAAVASSRTITLVCLGGYNWIIDSRREYS